MGSSPNTKIEFKIQIKRFKKSEEHHGTTISKIKYSNIMFAFVLQAASFVHFYLNNFYSEETLISF